MIISVSLHPERDAELIAEYERLKASNQFSQWARDAFLAKMGNAQDEQLAKIATLQRELGDKIDKVLELLRSGVTVEVETLESVAATADSLDSIIDMFKKG